MRSVQLMIIILCIPQRLRCFQHLVHVNGYLFFGNDLYGEHCTMRKIPESVVFVFYRGKIPKVETTGKYTIPHIQFLPELIYIPTVNGIAINRKMYIQRIEVGEKIINAPTFVIIIHAGQD